MRHLLLRWIVPQASCCCPGSRRTLARTWQSSLKRRLTGARNLSSTTDDVIFKSPRSPSELPQLSLSDYMFSRFDLFGEKDALVDDVTGNTFKFSQLEPLSRKIGSYFTKQGFKKGDVICYYGINNPEFTLLLLGCASIGVVLTTANPAYTAGELTAQIKHSGAKYVVTVSMLAPKIKETDIPSANVMMIGESSGYKNFNDMLKDDGKGFPNDVTIDPKEDLLIMPYSSGTTGLPKGVMLTHFNVVANLLQLKSAVTTTEADNNLGVLPFYHIYGLAPVLLGTIQDGATLFTTPNFEPQAFLTAIQKRRITLLHLVPPIMLFLARHPVVAKFDLSSVRDIISAAAPLGEGLTNEFMDKHKINLKQGYGLSETSPVVCLDKVPVTVGSVGSLISDTEAKIVDPETGKCLNRNEVGEICVRGPQNMKGYLNNEKATREMIAQDNWLHTGDIGCMKDNDCIVISDRLKELIKYKGMQVAPAELEDLLHQHPSVQDVAVVGVPDDRAGEIPRAYVVRNPKATVTEEDIQKYVEDNVSSYKKLRGGVAFLDEIPKSPSGKILRRLLKEK